MLFLAVETIVKSLVVIIILMSAAGYMTFLERIVMARLQLRLGPNRVGPLGLLQPLADGIKLLFKEGFEPLSVDKFTYWIAPGISLFISLFVFVLIPIGDSFEVMGRQVHLYIADLSSGIVFILAFSTLAVYGVVLAGWSSNDRYSLLGGLRGTAQIISYEIPMGIALLTVILDAGTLSLPEIVGAQGRYDWFVWTNPLSFIIYLITAFAETNRAPFDLPEAEQELTAGYHTEYGGMKFAMFFLGEYINILLVSSLATTLFLGGWHGPFDIPVLWFVVKVAILVYFFMWVRVIFPRFRYEQLLGFGWKVLVPLSVINLIITALCKLV